MRNIILLLIAATLMELSLALPTHAEPIDEPPARTQQQEQEEEEEQECSEVGETPTTVTFINPSDRTVVVYWVDYNCQEVEYQTLEPGQQYTQSTYVTHLWRVRDTANGNIVNELTASTQEPSILRVGHSDEGSDMGCSVEGNVPVDITFINNAEEPITTYWVDYGCEEVEYQTLNPGQQYTQPTFVTHPWRVRDRAGNLLREFTPDNDTPVNLRVSGD